MAELDGARREVKFLDSLDPYLPIIGEMPLPPYIHERLTNPERYQTVYSKTTGSAAAPTAGLHFTPELMEKIEHLGANFARITLHVGLDTFSPVNEEDPMELERWMGQERLNPSGRDRPILLLLLLLLAF